MNTAMAHTSDSPTRDLPMTIENQDLVSALFDLRPGDRILWGDRKVPCVVAALVDPDDVEAQAFTANVIPHAPTDYDPETDLRRGDVFFPTGWGGLSGERFVLIQGPRGGFYALSTLRSRGRTRVGFFRCIRAHHKTRSGFRGQGNFEWEGWFEDALTVVETGDAPEELDQHGDLPAYDEIRENRVLAYDPDADEHYRVGSVEEVLTEGVAAAYERAEQAREGGDEETDEGEETDAWAAVPDDVTRRARPVNGIVSDAAIVVREIVTTSYGLKAVLAGPAPWETPDGLTPMNEVLKALPWDATHRAWDPERKAWTVDADELSAIASELAHHGYPVMDEADRPTDASEDRDEDRDDDTAETPEAENAPDEFVTASEVPRDDSPTGDAERTEGAQERAGEAEGEAADVRTDGGDSAYLNQTVRLCHVHGHITAENEDTFTVKVALGGVLQEVLISKQEVYDQLDGEGGDDDDGKAPRVMTDGGQDEDEDETETRGGYAHRDHVPLSENVRRATVTEALGDVRAAKTRTRKAVNILSQAQEGPRSSAHDTLTDAYAVLMHAESMLSAEKALREGETE